MRLMGLSDEDRLAIEQASGGTIKTEAAKLIVDISTQQVMEQVQAELDELKEVQSIIGPQGSVTLLQAGGVNITPGNGVVVYDGGIRKTNIEPDGDLFVGSDLDDPSTTSFGVFVNDQNYNGEEFVMGDLLIGDNSLAKPNVKYASATGQLQFRYGTVTQAYMGVDGKIYAGSGAVILDTSGITATLGTIGGWVIGATSLKDVAGTVGMSSAVTGGDDIRFFAGNVTPASAPFRVTEAGALTATSATITGAITATSGTIGGWTIDSTTIQKLATNVGIILDSSASIIKVGDTGGTYIAIDGTNKHIQSSNYVAGLSGFHIDADSGDAEFNKITARGMIKTAVFEKDTISAIGGSLLVLDADVLATTMTAADNSTVTIEGNTTFAVGDILRMKDDTYDEWLEVTNISSAPTYTCTRDKAAAYGANANPAWKKGQAVVNYGPTGNGGLLFTSGATPSLKVFNHTGSPWTTTGTPVELSENGIIISGPNTTPYLTFKTEAGVSVATIFQDGAGNLQFDLDNAIKSFTFNDGNVICGHASTVDGGFYIHENFVLKAKTWWDASEKNLVLQNVTNLGNIVAIMNGDVKTEAFCVYDLATSLSPFRLALAGYMDILESASAPAYEADYAKFFYLDTGVPYIRGKQGAVETEYGFLTSTQVTDLTDGGDSTLHYHAADRAVSIPLDGWIPITLGSPTRTAATTFTTTTDLTSLWQKGFKLKFTDTTTKYAYVVAMSAYAGGVMTITIVGDALVGNPSAFSYSQIENPTGFPDWFSYTPTLSVSGGTAPTYTESFINRYTIKGKTLYGFAYWNNASGGTAGAGASDLLFTLSVTAVPAAPSRVGTGSAYESGGTIGGVMVAINSSTTGFFSLMSTGVRISGADQSSASRQITGVYTYEI
jgi:hypothetical protein